MKKYKQSINCLLYDIRHAIFCRWFIIALVLSIISLWLSVGTEAYELSLYKESNIEPNWDNMFIQCLSSDFSILIMPVWRTLIRIKGLMR